MMQYPIRSTRAEGETRFVSPRMAALIKAMLRRGDKQSDIAAWFLINSGRVAEINRGQLYPDVPMANFGELPPAPPYASHYDRWREL